LRYIPSKYIKAKKGEWIKAQALSLVSKTPKVGV